MTTKQKILNEALTLFSERGYNAVYVGDIAAAVGIKAPSLYKHYKSKKDIFKAILTEMESNYNKQTAGLNMNGNDAGEDASIFATVSEDTLVQMGIGLFQFFLHDDYASKFRKMLTIEQFHDNDLSHLYSKQYVDDPLSYQTSIFTLISISGVFKNVKPNIMALHFYAPIYMLLTVCDRQPEREKEALQLIEEHIRQFNFIYDKEH
ncbi:TetR/AcrR family transcriptional regulator [Frisingicoccus sp.]|uniref:TetR/AcrR family transcriptional regulator n=1 Tax=Frisingicoccus sp. TaxID=1918627 RepID=UPI0039997832